MPTYRVMTYLKGDGYNRKLFLTDDEELPPTDGSVIFDVGSIIFSIKKGKVWILDSARAWKESQMSLHTLMPLFVIH